MDNKVFITVGISASGKSTWAEEKIVEIQSAGEEVKHLNRDDIREELMNADGKEFSWAGWSFKREKEVQKIWRSRLSAFIGALSQNIIISDTNLNSHHLEQLENEFKNKGYETERVIFDVPFETCVKRDLQRKNPVGKDVISGQYAKFCKNYTSQIKADTSLPSAVIVDIDGTVAKNTSGRGWFDWHRVGEDSPKKMSVLAVRAYYMAGYDIIFLSGRMDDCKDITEKWLRENVKIPKFKLYMRKHNDCRKDTTVKEELFNEHIAGRFNVEIVMDDRPSVCRMWRSIGLETMQFGNPDMGF